MRTSSTFTIELTRTLPIDKKHGCEKGTQWEASYKYQGDNRDNPVTFKGKTGAEVVAFYDEYKIVTNDSTPFLILK